jgi:hypothetical protein
MADFNVNVKNVEDSSGFLGASRGASAPKQREFVSSAGSVVDMSGAIKSKGNALAGSIEMLGGLYNQAVSTADTYIKEQVDIQAREQTDQIFNEFGVDDTSTIEGTPTDREPVPSEIDKASRNLAKLTEAKNRGNLSDNAYWARMESVSRQLRARYPGHRDYIDQRISSIAGGKPANQIVQNLLSEANSGKNAAVAAERSRMQLVERATFAGLNGDGSLNSMSEGEILKKVGPFLARKEMLEQQKKELDMSDTALEQTQKMQAKQAQQHVQINLAQVINDVSSSVGGDYKSLMTEFNKYTNGKDPTAEEQEALRTQFANLKTKVMAGLRTDIIDNYGTTLSKDQRQEVLAPAEEWFGLLEESLSNPKNGMLVRMANKLEAWKAQDVVNLYETSPAARALGSYNKLLGPETTALILNGSAELKTALDRELVATFFDSLATGKGPAIADQIRVAQRDKTLGANVPKQVLRTQLEILNNPATPIKDKELAAKSLYRKENMSYLDSDIVKTNEQPAVYGRFINQNTYDQVKEIGGTVVDDYKSWATQNFYSVFRPHIDNLREVDANLIRYDAKLGQFSTVDFIGTGENQQALKNQSIQTAKDRLNVLNAGIRNIMPILKDEGIDPIKFLETGFGKIFKGGTATRMNLGQKVVNESDITPESMRLAPGQEGIVIMNDGSVAGRGTQVTPEQGDSMQLEEISNLITRKQQDLRLFKELQKDGDPEAIDGVDRTLGELMELIKERDSITNQWIEQFKQERIKLKGPMS